MYRLTRVLTLALLISVAGVALPVVFEENRGQVAPDVRFLTRTPGYRLFLTSAGAVIQFQDGRAVRIELAHANHSAPKGTGLLLAKTNYLLGPDPARWNTGIPNFDRVTYPQVYSGIDLVWHARGGEIEHDFLIAPGADPRRVRLRLSGPGLEPALTPDSDLLVGGLRFHKPRAYQGSREIDCRYELRGRSVGFALGTYDHTRPLTIDPVLSFSTYFGGTTAATAVDGAGNVYVVGSTAALNFPVTAGAFQTTPGGGQCSFGGGFGPPLPIPCTDIFIAKFSADGSTLLNATYLGGPGNDEVTAIAVEPAGNLYLLSGAYSPAFPKLKPLTGQTITTSMPLVAKMSADLSSLVYATALPVPAKALAVDSAGAVYITGITGTGAAGSNLQTVNAFQPTQADAGLFKTADGAGHWQPLGPGLLGRMVAADPSNPQVLYLGGISGLYKTSDSGMHWSSIANGIKTGTGSIPTSLVIDPHSPQTLYLGVSSPCPCVYQSADGGASWAASDSGLRSAFSVPGFTTLTLDPTNSSTLYAGTPTGIYKSTDGALTWNPTWSPTDSNVYAYRVYRIVVDPTRPATIYASTQSGVMKSNDGGARWNPMNNGIAASPNTSYPSVADLAIDPTSPQTLYAASFEKVYKTTDGAAHWTQSPVGSSVGVDSLLVDPGQHSRIYAGTDDGVLLSLDSGASWARTAVPHLQVLALAADANGSIYAANYLAPGDAFVMKLDPTGSSIVYSTYLGGSGRDLPGGIAVDAAGRAYIAGETDSFDFPLAAPLQPSYGGNSDAFVAVLDSSGSHLVWSTYVGGSSAEGASAIALDPAGDVHLAGVVSPTHSFPSGNIFFAGDPTADAFVAKIKGDGSAVIYSAHLGGSAYDGANSVTADAAGNTYIAGMTYSQDLSTLNPFQPNLAGGADAFAAEFDGRTGAVQYATYLGGSLGDSVSSISADAAGNLYLVGQTRSADFPLKSPYQTSPSQGFVVKIAAQPSSIKGVMNAASYTPMVAPGELVSIFWTALAAAAASATQHPLPTQLSDAQVTVNSVSAPLVYASSGQVNMQIPFETQPGTAQVQVTSSAGNATMTLQVVATAPAIFAVNQQGTGPGAILHGTTYQAVNDSSPATPGEIVSIYCTGLGAVNPPAQTGAAPPDPPSQTTIPVQVSIGGVAAPVLYQGVAPGFPGLYQVNAQIPAGTPSGAQPLQIIQNGAASNTVTVAVQ